MGYLGKEPIRIKGKLFDSNNHVGTASSVLTSTGTGVSWTSTSDLSGIVTSITAGSGISVDQSTGNVTITATGGGSSGIEILEEGSSVGTGITILDFVGSGVTATIVNNTRVKIDITSGAGGGGGGDVVDDTTPQLGGDLDLNGNDITGTGNINVSGVTTASSFVKSGGTSSEFLKADGSVDSNTYLTSYSETDTLDDVTSRGNSTTNSVTVGELSSSGIVTASQFSTGATGTGINITTNTISGPSELTIDPAGVGDDTGSVRIKGDLYVDGTQTVINSTTVEIADFVVGIATTATTPALMDGAGIKIGINKTFLYNDNSGNNPSLKSSENLNVASGKHYQVGETEVLSSTTLGSGVTLSSLTTVGTLTHLNVSGVTTASSFIKSGGTSSQFLKADGSVDTNTYLTSESDTLAKVTARASSTTSNITANGFIKSGGTSSQFLKADGSVDSNSYLSTSGTIDADLLDGINSTSFLRSDFADQKTSGTLRFNDNVSLTLGTSDDFQLSTDSNGITRLSGVVSNNSLIITGSGSNSTEGNLGLTLNATQNSSNIKLYNGGKTELLFKNLPRLETDNHGVKITGIVTATSFSGSGSSLTGLTGASSGTYGDATNSAQITVDANGRITGITNVSITGGGGGGGGLADIVDDTTPQLGGNLDLNGNDITGTGDIDITGTISVGGTSGQYLKADGSYNTKVYSTYNTSDTGFRPIAFFDASSVNTSNTSYDIKRSNNFLYKPYTGELNVGSVNASNYLYGPYVRLTGTSGDVIRIDSSNANLRFGSSDSMRLRKDNDSSQSIDYFNINLYGSNGGSKELRITHGSGAPIRFYSVGSAFESLRRGGIFVNYTGTPTSDALYVSGTTNLQGNTNVSGVLTATSFAGDASGLTNVPAATTGTNVVYSGIVTASAFVGDASYLSNVKSKDVTPFSNYSQRASYADAISGINTAKIVGIMTAGDIYQDRVDQFGHDVTCSYDGSIIYVSARQDEKSPRSSGSGVVYAFDGNLNSLGPIVDDYDSFTGVGDYFGQRIETTADGKTLFALTSESYGSNVGSIVVTHYDEYKKTFSTVGIITVTNFLPYIDNQQVNLSDFDISADGNTLTVSIDNVSGSYSDKVIILKRNGSNTGNVGLGLTFLNYEVVGIVTGIYQTTSNSSNYSSLNSLDLSDDGTTLLVADTQSEVTGENDGSGLVYVYKEYIDSGTSAGVGTTSTWVHADTLYNPGGDLNSYFGTFKDINYDGSVIVARQNNTFDEVLNVYRANAGIGSTTQYTLSYQIPYTGSISQVKLDKSGTSLIYSYFAFIGGSYIYRFALHKLYDDCHNFVCELDDGLGTLGREALCLEFTADGKKVIFGKYEGRLSGVDQYGLAGLIELGTETFLYSDPATGNIGIGSTNPEHKLEVVGDARIHGALYDNANSYGTFGQTIISDGSGGFEWGAASGGGGGSVWKVDETISGISTTHKVGIGSTQPNVPLDVVGTIRGNGFEISGKDSVTYSSRSESSNYSDSIAGITTYTKVGILTASNAAANDQFGYDVECSADGNIVAVGAYLKDSPGGDAGAIYVFDRTGSSFKEIGYFPGFTQAGEEFGQNVLVTKDGTRIFGTDDYSIRHFRVVGVGTEKTVELKETIARPYISSGSANNFAISISCSADGHRLFVGDSFGEDPVNNNVDTGAVYIYEVTDQGNYKYFDTITHPEASTEAGQYFGKSLKCSADGETLIVSAEGTFTGLGNATYVYERRNNEFANVGIITAIGNTYSSDYGTDTDISADGNIILVSDQQDGTYGSVFVYRRVSTATTSYLHQLAEITGTATTRQYFGSAVACNADGSIIAIGHRYDDPLSGGGIEGSVELYRRIGDNVKFIGKIHSPFLASGEFFGLHGLTLSDDGKKLYVGASGGRLTDEGGTSIGPASGVVYVYDAEVESFVYSSPNGDIGIGVSNPSYKLHVDGTVAANSFVGDASGLTNVPAATSGSSIVYSGIVTAATFQGDGKFLRGLPQAPLALYSSRSKTSHKAEVLAGVSTYSSVGILSATGSSSAQEFGEFLDLSADGNILVFHNGLSGSSSVVFAYDTSGNAPTKLQEFDGLFDCNGLKITPDGKRLLIIRENGSNNGDLVEVWDRTNTDDNYDPRYVDPPTSPFTKVSNLRHVGPYYPGASQGADDDDEVIFTRNTIATSSDGNVIFVGAPDADVQSGGSSRSSAGVLYAYRYVPEHVGLGTTMFSQSSVYIPYDDTNSFANFGKDIACTSDGNRVVVGAPGLGVTGTVYVYDFIQKRDFASTDADYQFVLRSNLEKVLTSTGSGTLGSVFGAGVDISSDGKYIAVGDYDFTQSGQTVKGVVHIFEGSGIGTNTSYALIQTLVPTDSTISATDYFGVAVRFNQDASLLFISDEKQNLGNIQVFHRRDDEFVYLCQLKDRFTPPGVPFTRYGTFSRGQGGRMPIALSADGERLVVHALRGQLPGSSTNAGYIEFLDKVVENRLNSDRDGNIGIGTTANSSYKLNVVGDLNFTGDLYQDGTLFSGGGGGGGDVVDDTTPQLGGDLDLNGNDIVGTGNIDITGNTNISGVSTFVGIVTAQSDLFVDNDLYATEIYVDTWRLRQNQLTNSYIGGADLRANVELRIGDTGNFQRTATFDITNKRLGINTESSAKTLYVNGDCYIDGNTGIGELNPSYKLDVGGDINFTGNLYQNGSFLTLSGISTANIATDSLVVSGVTTCNGVIRANDGLLISTGNLNLNDTGALSGQITAVGRNHYFGAINDNTASIYVNIGGRSNGTVKPSVSQLNFGITSSGTASYIQSTAAGLLMKQNTSGNYFRLDSYQSGVELQYSGNTKFKTISNGATLTGNLGIDVTNPSYALDVAGTARITDNISHRDAIFHENRGNTKTFTVTVASKTAEHRYSGSGSTNGFVIDGIQAPFITLTPGSTTWRFDQSDSSNSGHPLRFYLEADKTTQYTTNVTTAGTPGSTGAYTEIIIDESTPTTLYYQCSSHALMGNAIDTQAVNKNIFLADESLDTTCYPVFSKDATGFQELKTDSSALSYNASTGTLSATAFAGDGSGLTGLPSSGIQAVVDDTSPQLGGSLTLAGNDITGTGDIDIIGGVNVSGVSTASYFEGNGSRITGIVTSLVAGSGIAIDQSTGRVTITNTGGGGGGGITGVVFKEEGTTVGTAATINFIGSGTTVTVANGVATVDITSGGAGGGGVSDIVEDTTPQLGGTLDLNGNDIIGTGNINITGIITSTQFVGDGSGLTNIVSTGTGVVVQDEGSNVGTAATINFAGSNVQASLSNGVATVTVTPGISETLAIAYAVAL